MSIESDKFINNPRTLVPNEFLINNLRVDRLNVTNKYVFVCSYIYSTYHVENIKMNRYFD